MRRLPTAAQLGKLPHVTSTPIRLSTNPLPRFRPSPRQSFMMVCYREGSMRRRFSRRGFSLIELLIVISIILILMAVAVPKYEKMQMNTRELAAIKQIQTIHSAQTQYYSQFGKYATVLTELGAPASGNAGPSGADLIPNDLAKGTKTGYTFTVTGTPTGYTVNANPVSYNGTGRRCFFSDQSFVIRENWGPDPAKADSPEIK